MELSSEAKTHDVAPVVPATKGRQRMDDKLDLPASPPVTSATVESQMHEGRVKPQVDKLRHASSVVLNEASYDSSIRFILVAGFLFIVFLVLLLLSKWLS